MRVRLLVPLLVISATAAFGGSDSKSKDIVMDAREICLVALSSTANITLTLVVPTQPGAKPADVTNNTKRLRYTSCVPVNTTRQVQVSFGSGTQAPAGTALLVQASGVPADCGTAGAQVTIGSAAQAVITAIGSCATGRGATAPRMTYTLTVSDMSQLAPGTTVATVVFTLTDAS